MLTGLANQQLARNLARTTVEGRENTVRAFAAYVNAFPWQWTPAMVDEWLGDLRSVRDLKRSTIRSYSEAVRSFCDYVTDPLYDWAATCEERFGTHPVQVVHEWNTAVHVQDDEADADEAGVHPGRAAGVLRPLRRRGRPHPRRRPQGLAAGVPRRDPVQDRLRLRAAPQRDADAGRRRLRPQPARRRVRRVRRVPGPVRQGQEGLAAQTPQRADRLALDPGGPRRVVQRGPAAVRHRRQPGGLALRTRARGSAASGSTPASSPTATPSAWTPAWTSTRCAGPTSPT